MHTQNQGKLASVCLQQFSSIFETTKMLIIKSPKCKLACAIVDIVTSL